MKQVVLKKMTVKRRRVNLVTVKKQAACYDYSDSERKVVLLYLQPEMWHGFLLSTQSGNSRVTWKQGKAQGVLLESSREEKKQRIMGQSFNKCNIHKILKVIRCFH